MFVQYGDIGIEGDYEFVSDRMIQITGPKGTLLWQVSFENGRLILVNDKNKWIEKYEREK